MPAPTRSDVTVDGVRTSWLESGAGGTPLLLLHGGAWGESADTAWSSLLPHLDGRRVLAPDWLGFGESDKLRDFVDLQGRMVSVLAGWLTELGVDEVDAVGLSMGGANLLKDQCSDSPQLPVRRLVLLSAGGAPIAGPARARLGDYDGSLPSMREQVRLSCADPSLAEDGDYLERRHATSLLPGAYEMMASLGLRSPTASPPPPGDPVPYERIGVPTLFVTGGKDALKPAGFADEAVSRVPQGTLESFPEAGHCVQLDDPAGFARTVLAFLDGADGADGAVA